MEERAHSGIYRVWQEWGLSDRQEKEIGRVLKTVSKTVYHDRGANLVWYIVSSQSEEENVSE